MHLYRKTFAKIDLDAIRDNFLFFQKHYANFLCPMVKANAYGHGDIQVSKTLEQAGCRYLGVGLIEEAIRLRHAGVKTQIMMYGLFEKDGAEIILQEKIIPVLSTWSQIEILQKLMTGTLPVHVKFDTGMHRLGFAMSEADKVFDFLTQHKEFQLQGVCTHLAIGEDLGQKNAYTEKQLNSFKAIVKKFSPLTSIFHAYNSAAALNALDTKITYDVALGARPGLGIYGHDPREKTQLKPSMSLYSNVVRYISLPKGERVSYNGTWTSRRDSVIGVIPIGYADGYHRLLSNKSQVLFRGQKASLVGTVCMDYFMVDLTDILKSGATAKEGEEVVLMGQQGSEHITAEEMAKNANTICYEVFCQIGSRVPRVYFENNQITSRVF